MKFCIWSVFVWSMALCEMKIEGGKVRSERRGRERELSHLQHKGASVKRVPEEQLLGFFFFFLLQSLLVWQAQTELHHFLKPIKESPSPEEMQLRCSPAGSRKCRCSGAAGRLPERPSGGSAAGAACGAPRSSPCSRPWRWLQDLPALVSRKAPFPAEVGPRVLPAAMGPSWRATPSKLSAGRRSVGTCSLLVFAVFTLSVSSCLFFSKLWLFLPLDLSPNSSKQILQLQTFPKLQVCRERKFPCWTTRHFAPNFSYFLNFFKPHTHTISLMCLIAKLKAKHCFHSKGDCQFPQPRCTETGLTKEQPVPETNILKSQLQNKVASTMDLGSDPLKRRTMSGKAACNKMLRHWAVVAETLACLQASLVPLMFWQPAAEHDRRLL